MATADPSRTTTEIAWHRRAPVRDDLDHSACVIASDVGRTSDAAGGPGIGRYVWQAAARR
ncbi:hypothetical protein ACIRPK_07770 [Kitasatospora sp. NPDC101801]|uniref:hypothetical protein n=1 Tax=Kitasatospora sp. NPDC101801 TaxID=3364103 RepID=UPI0037FEE46D